VDLQEETDSFSWACGIVAGTHTSPPFPSRRGHTSKFPRRRTVDVRVRTAGDGGGALAATCFDT